MRFAKIIALFLTSYIGLICITMISCQQKESRDLSTEFITDLSKQQTIFAQLEEITNDVIIEGFQGDSLAFLVLPVQASCPSCRKKVIDSIMKHKHDLADRHFIIISANGGRKTINSYFKERGGEIPDMEKRLFLDSVNLGHQLTLFKDKPTIYYAYDRKVYKRVSSIPSTVKDDLKEFFSGNRDK